jgi:hypothetical protein
LLLPPLAEGYLLLQALCAVAAAGCANLLLQALQPGGRVLQLLL